MVSETDGRKSSLCNSSGTEFATPSLMFQIGNMSIRMGSRLVERQHQTFGTRIRSAYRACVIRNFETPMRRIAFHFIRTACVTCSPDVGAATRKPIWMRDGTLYTRRVLVVDPANRDPLRTRSQHAPDQFQNPPNTAS